MSIFKKLFGKKQNTPNETTNESVQKEEVLKDETPQKLNLDTSQTSEKFLHLADEITCFLTDILQELHSLEQEIYERNELLMNPDEPNQLQPGEKELWAEYKQRRKEITDPVSLNPSDEGSRSFGKPTEYEYLSYPDTKITFIMKSANRAVIETEYQYGIGRKHQFVLKKDGENWKIDTKKYGFPNETTWYKDEL